MRLVTYLEGSIQRIGAVYGSTVIDLSAFAQNMLALIKGGSSLLANVHAMVSATVEQDTSSSAASLALDHATLLAPIPRPYKNIVCLGKNYAAHVSETSRALGRHDTPPDHPVFFTKAVTTINHPDGIIPYDASISTHIDWEVELALIIGRTGKNIHRDEAMDYVFGYTIMNDITARDIQRRHRQYYKGKSLDGSAPLGPWIVTADEIADPHALGLRLRVNGVTMQEASTSAMIHTIPDIIAILSQGTTLEAGDIIATGTPEGVGMAMEPPQFLKPGDVVEAEIEGIGVLRNRIGSA
jgi:2-keto-4-pentenoate hydratase/2-oxohepta-3-ene-1,7-dioic acid hydratase in catechol pathway